MVKPVVAPTPTGTVDVFLDGLSEGTIGMPFVWVILVVCAVGGKLVSILAVDFLRDMTARLRRRRAARLAAQAAHDCR